ncbi:MAG: hypothetical protein HC827_19255 [Cyanobacteria bacterium RM1_2_2]|nr:hypothetical protein [Cyanobacteria bacterium RM1_2_2]
MSQRTDVAQCFNTFINLLKELELFAEVNDLRLSFDREGNVYLLGTNFQHQLRANPTVWSEVKEEMRQIIAQHCPRVAPRTIEQPTESHE